MSRRAVSVATVDAGGVAARAGVRVGDRVLAVDGEPVLDSLDFELLASEPEIVLDLARREDELRVVLAREWGETLGLAVTHRPRACRLRCRFCFVDQQPRGLRRSLCLKDDDLALSFRDGNFLTLSNFDDEDLRRVRELGLSPLYVSVHATDPAVRDRLLRPRGPTGRDVRPILDALVEAEVTIHAQVVLAPGYNDGDHLERTLNDLAPLVPAVRSIAVVPLGLTRFQIDPTLRVWRPDEAPALLEQVAPWRERFSREVGVPVVVPSDEWYLLAGREPPPADRYDGFPQIENGVGLVRRFLDELNELDASPLSGRRVVLATGALFGPVLRRAAESPALAGAGLEVRVVESRFWGPTVTVAGLLTGADLAAGLAGVAADAVLVPSVVLNDDGYFLDGKPADWLEDELVVPVRFVAPDPGGLVEGLNGAWTTGRSARCWR